MTGTRAGTLHSIDNDHALLVLGASARAAAQSAVSAGFRVVAADLFADRDLRRVAPSLRVSRYPDDFANIRQAFPSLPVVYTGALENYPELLNRLGAKAPLYGNSGDVVRRVRDPLALHDAFQQATVAVPLTRFDPPSPVSSEPWLRKPLRSAGGRGVRMWDFEMATDEVTSECCYFQQFVPGLPCSASFVATGGHSQLLGVAEMLSGCRWAGTDDFCYCGSIQRSAPPAEESQWRRIGELLAQKFSLAGLFGVDAVLSEERVFPIEVNPRYTASMELFELATGRSMIQMHVEACTEGILPVRLLPSARRRAFGKAILFAPHTLRLPTSVVDWPATQSLDATLADLPAPGSLVAEGHPILTVIAQASNRQRVEATLRAVSQQVFDSTTPAV